MYLALPERPLLLPPLRPLRTLRAGRGERGEPRHGLRREVPRLAAELDAGARGPLPRHDDQLAQQRLRVLVELGQRGRTGPHVRRHHRDVPSA